MHREAGHLRAACAALGPRDEPGDDGGVGSSGWKHPMHREAGHLRAACAAIGPRDEPGDDGGRGSWGWQHPMHRETGAAHAIGPDGGRRGSVPRAVLGSSPRMTGFEVDAMERPHAP